MLNLLVLAVVQGVAEFLPISSSGHLVLLGALLPLAEDSATVNIVLHAGTLASILVVYWRRILQLLWADRRVIPLLVVGTIPAGAAGVIIKTQFPWLLENAVLAGLMLIVTGAVLLVLPRLSDGERSYRELGWGSALEIGVFQAFALLPGISRSGMTIVGGRMLGLGRDDAVTFSFLLAIPAILGATVLEALDLLKEGVDAARLGPLLLAAAVACVVGVFALRWLIDWSRRGQLHRFAYWVIPLGVVVVGWQLWR